MNPQIEIVILRPQAEESAVLYDKQIPRFARHDKIWIVGDPRMNPRMLRARAGARLPSDYWRRVGPLQALSL
jgi:hypothetical protein